MGNHLVAIAPSQISPVEHYILDIQVQVTSAPEGLVYVKNRLYANSPCGIIIKIIGIDCVGASKC